MTERVIVRRGAYYDSVTLMLVSRAASGDGQEVSVGMATPRSPLRRSRSAAT